MTGQRKDLCAINELGEMLPFKTEQHLKEKHPEIWFGNNEPLKEAVLNIESFRRSDEEIQSK